MVHIYIHTGLYVLGLRRGKIASTYVGISKKNCTGPGSTQTKQPRGGPSRIPVPGGFSCRFQPLEKIYSSYYFSK